MTTPKPVDLEEIETKFDLYGWADIHWTEMEPIVDEIKHLRARVKELEDGINRNI